MTFTNHNWAVTVHLGVKSVPAPTTKVATVQTIPSEPKTPTDVTGAVQIILIAICILVIGGIWIKKSSERKFPLWWK